MSLCADCIKGVRHEGTPEGKWETINGVECYIGTPNEDYPKNKVLLFCTDAYGPQLINNQLLVDDFARNGIKTVAVDYFQRDAVPVEAVDGNMKFDVGAWIGRHGPEVTRPLIDKVIEALKSEGVTEFAAIGYCYGGRYTFNLAFDNVTSVSVVNHPSLLKSPEDLEKYAATSRAPLLINSCTVDTQFPHEAQAQADEILGGGKFAPGYKREYFDGCTHGFAVRGDLSDPKVKAGKEGAFNASAEWLLTRFIGVDGEHKHAK